MNSSRPIAFVLFIIAFCTALAGASMLLSAIYSNQADAFLEDWKNKGTVPSEQAWNITHTAVQRANRFYPIANGDLLDQQGRVYEWYAFSQWAKPELIPGYQQQAINAYRQSIAARPTWPFTWRNLALAKLRANQLDEELFEASKQALHFGPYEKSVLLDIAGISFQEFRRDARFKTLATTSVMRLSDWGPKEKRLIWSQAKQQGAFITLCEELTIEFKRRHKVCFEG